MTRISGGSCVTTVCPWGSKEEQNMKATYYQRGETLDYFPTENVENLSLIHI